MGRTGNLWPLLVALATLARLSESKLKLKVSQSPVEVIYNENSLLLCEISELTGATLESKNLGVLWTVTRGTEASTAFSYTSGDVQEAWPEAEILESSILNGNMSLLLRHVTFKHTGQYKCEVVIPPNNKASQTVKLEVLARPTVTVVSEKVVEVGTGGEMALGCHLSGYYPCESNAEWFQSIPSQEERKLLTDICIAPTVKNPDGTCNVTTEVRLEPHVEDIGSTFECLVTHKTFSEPYLVQASVTLKEAEIRLSTSSIVGSVIASIIISIALTALVIFLYLRFCYKVAPKVSEIQRPVKLIHQELAEFVCQVSGYRPNVITVSWYLKRCNETKEKLIADWQVDDLFHFQFITDKKMERNADTSETGMKWKVKAANVRKNNDGTFSISSILEVYPDFDVDNSAQITCKVMHPSEREGILRTIRLQIDGVPPKLANIIKPPVVHHNNSVTLTCPINFFKPHPLKITWYKIIDGEKIYLVEHNNGAEENFYQDKYSHYLVPFSYPDHTLSVCSMLLFHATIQEDENSQYSCEVGHISLSNPAEKHVQLNVKAYPSLNAIISEPGNPVIGEQLTLTCKVHSFYPKNITVRWLKNDDVIMNTESPEIVNSENELYECTSLCTITATLSDLHSKYKCQVLHESLMYPRFTEYTPESLVSFPKVSEITCNHATPELERELTLTCKIIDFYPEDIQVEWFRNEVRCDDVKYGRIMETSLCENGLYSKVSTVTLTASADDHQAEYRIEVYHSKSSTKPFKQFYQLFLKGSPKFSEFRLEPESPLYGQPLSVSTSVCEIPHDNITVEWYKASERIKGVTNSKPVLNSENTYKINSCLKFTVTAEDFERDLHFQYKDNSNTDVPVFKRRIQLPLTAVTPKVSEIKCSHDHPKKGENATLTCRIEHFCPADIHIIWSKGWTEYKDKQSIETPKIDSKGLYSTVTRLPIVAIEGSSEYICEVQHAKTNDIIEKMFVLNV
ncbi:uncharacterized protein [Scyliorhinus torazame]|uniref:uncharacterized protein isoform X1 n=2 Tax=Scyliorhinus torazame TaxID=75743 RepID=UPI003B5C7AAC